MARHGLTTAIDSLAYHVLILRRVAADVARHEANYFAFDIGRRIEAGTVQPGHEDAFVRQCARNRAIDHHREQSGIRARYEVLEEAELLADHRDPERLMAERQEAALLAAKVQHLRTLIATAPSAYANVLLEVHVKGALIEVLAARELATRLERGDERVNDAASLKRARATVDQRLCRARAWLREQLGLGAPSAQPSAVRVSSRPARRA
jgi:DNA-directed RNA polymerase specialized sigma24 family protein